MGPHGALNDCLRFSPRLGAFDPFGKIAKEKRKQNVQLAQQANEQELEVARQKQQAAALDAFRRKVQERLDALERTARDTATLVESVRAMSQEQLLIGDPILERVDKDLADVEEGLVRVQTGVVVSAATVDPDKLAISYTDAQAAVVAMNALKTRVAGVASDLRGYLEQLRAEPVRVDALEKRRAALLAREADLRDQVQARVQQAAQSAQRDQDLAARTAAWRTQQQEQARHDAFVASQAQALERQIDSERRDLERARLTLFKLRAAAS